MDESEELTRIIRDRQYKLFLSVIIILCIIITLYVNLVMSTDVVYTHLFYIPIILAAIWYHEKAIYLAIFLGLAHISIGYYDEGHIVDSTFVRAAIFIIVALVVGYLSEKRDMLYDSVRMLLESTDEGIYGVDDQGLCTFINQSAIKMLGFTRAEVRKKNMHDLIHHTRADGRPCSKDECCVIRSLRDGTGCRDGDDIFWKKDGTSFPVEYSSNPVFENNSITGAVVTFTDITERKKAERDIRDAKRQAELYVDLMGHDINNMNQTGISYLELALEKLNLSDEDRVYLTKPLETLYNSSGLIDTVRKLQKLKEGAVRHQKVDMCKIIREVISRYSHVPDREVTISFSHDSGCFVLADELLKDVFSNIIGNAIKHSSGPVAIDVLVSTLLENSRQYYRVDISDNGSGIPDDIKKQLFTRYQRDKVKITGHGIGLYLVKKLVDDLDGMIWVEDRVPGDRTKGARFVILIPSLLLRHSDEAQADEYQHNADDGQ